MKKRYVGLLVLLVSLCLCAVASAAGWQIVDGSRVIYLNKKNQRVTGQQKIVIGKTSQTFWFTDEGYLMSTLSDTLEINGEKYCVINNYLVSGWQSLTSGKYYFDSTKKAVKGWREISGYFYYFDPTTAIMKQGTSWENNGQLFTFDENGILQSNGRTVVINGTTYHLRAANDTGATTVGLNQRWSGWWTSPTDGSSYYFGPYTSDDGTQHSGLGAATGACYIVNAKEHFLFDSNGRQLMGLIGLYFYDPDSATAAWAPPASHAGARYYGGWKVIAGVNYYFNENGTAVTGLQLLPDQGNPGNYNYYYFSGEGQMQVGRVMYNGKVYFFDDTAGANYGKMITGPYTTGTGETYYLTKDGALTGLQTLDMGGGIFNKYYFNDEGVMQSRWVTINSRLYYFDPNNGGVMVQGWQTIEGNTYFFEPNMGYAVVGQQTLTDRNGLNVYEYYFSGEGKMQVGLQTIDGRKYYYDPSAGVQRGKRMSGWWQIGGVDYYFQPYALTNTLQMLVDGRPGGSGIETYFQFDSEGRATVAESGVMNFVRRCYGTLLGRDMANPGNTPDPQGVQNWSELLLSGQMNAATVIRGFLESDEFTTAGVTNEQKVDMLYQTLLDRNADQSEKDSWSTFLDAGVSDSWIINRFSNSEEFAILCNQYGIQAGELEEEVRDINPWVTAFVNRCYKEALNREGEADGLNSWCAMLLTDTMDPKQVAHGFVFSDEMQNAYGGNNQQMVEQMYKLYMGRSPQNGEEAGWVNLLNSGVSLEDVNRGFADSAEFAQIIDSFDLK